MGLWANLLASDTVNYEFTIICRAVINGFTCAIAQINPFAALQIKATVFGFSHCFFLGGGGYYANLYSTTKITTCS